MISLLPYLGVDRGTAGCVELVNNARTLAYIGRGTQPRPAGVWQLTPQAECDTCPEYDTGDYSFPSDWQNDPAPWADPGRPASWEFFGLLLDRSSMLLEQSAGTRRRGASSYAPPAYAPRTLTITGTIISSSERGTAYGEEWLLHHLSGGACAPTDTFTAKVLRYCPDETAEEFLVWQALPSPVTALQPVLFEDGTPVLYDDGTPLYFEREPLIGSDACVDVNLAVPLEPLPEAYVPPYLPDPGWRDLLRCRFVSFDFLDDEPMPLCEGKRIAIVIEVLGEGIWFPAEDAFGYVQRIPIAFDPDLARTWDLTAERPIEFASPCGVCGLLCRCSSAAAYVETWPVKAEGCYREPLVAVPVAALTPVLPWSVQAGLVVEIDGGSYGQENVAVRIYEAVDGVPSPMTVLGCRIYDARRPCAEALISGIPPSSVLTLDGRRNRVMLDCGGLGVRPGEALVQGSEGRPFAHPRLSCGQRYWVVITADFYHLSQDADITLRYVPVEHA